MANGNKKFWSELSKRNRYAAVESVQDHYYSTIKYCLDELRDKGKVFLPDFGTLELRERSGRRIRNVNTGLEDHAKSAKVIVFLPCKRLKEYLERIGE